jgi:hypothetical protein
MAEGWDDVGEGGAAADPGGPAAEEGAADAPAEPVLDRKELQKQSRDVWMELRKVMGQLGKLKRKVAADEEVKELKKALDEAQKAYNEKVEEKLAADPEGKELVAKKNELDAKRKDIQDKMRKLRSKGRKPKKDKPAKKPKKKKDAGGDAGGGGAEGGGDW